MAFSRPFKEDRLALPLSTKITKPFYRTTRNNYNRRAGEQNSVKKLPPISCQLDCSLLLKASRDGASTSDANEKFQLSAILKGNMLTQTCTTELFQLVICARLLLSVIWNSRTLSVRHSFSLSSFKSKVKTHPFSSAYRSVVFFLRILPGNPSPIIHM